jgi:hypothetical protein
MSAFVKEGRGCLGRPRHCTCLLSCGMLCWIFLHRHMARWTCMYLSLCVLADSQTCMMGCQPGCRLPVLLTKVPPNKQFQQKSAWFPVCGAARWKYAVPDTRIWCWQLCEHIQGSAVTRVTHWALGAIISHHLMTCGSVITRLQLKHRLDDNVAQNSWASQQGQVGFRAGW